MLPTDMFEFNVKLPELDGHEAVEDNLRNDYAECNPIPNGMLACSIAYSEPRIVFYLLMKILRPPRFLGFFSENGFTHRVGHNRNFKLARAEGMIPVMMGINDLTHRRETGLS